MVFNKHVTDLEEKMLRHLEEYESGLPTISDKEYDNMIYILKTMAPESKVLELISNNKRGNEVRHNIAMLSLDKVNNQVDLFKWLMEGRSYVVSAKIDGVAIAIRYKRNAKGEMRFYRAVTRGNGLYGKNISDIVVNIPEIPKVINMDLSFNEFEVRGEAYITKSDFQALKDIDGNFITARNLVAGSLNVIENENILKDRRVRFFAYQLIADELFINADKQQKFSLNYVTLEEMGFKVVPHKVVKGETEIMDAILAIEKKRDFYPFEIDGAVVLTNSVLKYVQAGHTSHHYRGAIAYKFKSESETATLKSIEWNVGRTGVLTPVAIFTPTVINGVTIKRATLHNLTYMIEKRLHIGDKLEIARAGDVIPHVDRNLTPHGSIDENIILKICPVCGESVERRISLGNVENIYCINGKCQSKLYNRVIHWVNTLELKGIGEKLIEKLIDIKLVKDIPDLYLLTQRDFMVLDSVKDKSAKNFYEIINSKKNLKLYTFMTAIGLDGIGLSTAKKIFKDVSSIEEVFALKVSQLSEIDGVGDILANNIVEGIHNLKGLIYELMKEIKIDYTDNKRINDVEGKLSGMSFSATGTLSRPRNKIVEMINANGGTFDDTPLKTTNYIIVDDKDARSGKADKARKFGCKFLFEHEFMKMLEK